MSESLYITAGNRAGLGTVAAGGATWTLTHVKAHARAPQVGTGQDSASA